MGAPGVVAFAYFVASRLAYVVGVGAMLKRQKSRQVFTRDGDVERGYRRFRFIAATLMNNDGAAFVILCLLTRETLSFRVHSVPMICGVVLCIVGVGTKLWAARRLGDDAYYWRDFFAPHELSTPDPPGPYRFIKNPMYTLGYLQAYGVALFLLSGPGLVAAAFAQAAILVFHALVEKPHFEHLTGRT